MPWARQRRTLASSDSEDSSFSPSYRTKNNAESSSCWFTHQNLLKGQKQCRPFCSQYWIIQYLNANVSQLGSDFSNQTHVSAVYKVLPAPLLHWRATPKDGEAWLYANIWVTSLLDNFHLQFLSIFRCNYHVGDFRCVITECSRSFAMHNVSKPILSHLSWKGTTTGLQI